jgi:hypothetical protein
MFEEPSTPNIDPLAAPALLGSAFTVTVVNPSPPTNISYVPCGSPPNYTMTPNPTGRGAPTYTDDLNLFAPAGTPAALTVISSPIGGGSGPTSEATGTVVVVTAPGSRTECPTQSISVQGLYTTSPNSAHPSSGTQYITSLAPNPTPSGTGTIALTVNGARFTAATVVYVDGAAQVTAVINPAQVTVAAAPKRATAGYSQVTVVTGGNVSGAVAWNFS